MITFPYFAPNISPEPFNLATFPKMLSPLPPSFRNMKHTLLSWFHHRHATYLWNDILRRSISKTAIASNLFINVSQFIYFLALNSVPQTFSPQKWAEVISSLYPTRLLTSLFRIINIFDIYIISNNLIFDASLVFTLCPGRKMTAHRLIGAALISTIFFCKSFG